MTASVPDPDVLGAYRLLEVLGEGGMSEVFLAERADRQFEQRVALKVLKPGRANAEGVRRFQQERQIVASLDHPNIARLLDGGLTPDERPYFVMEHVDGEPIDRYCDARRLPVDERLRLFRVTADAVRHAHQNLLVHRDLKPGNIFVNRDGVVKLLDFGIAKLLPADAASQGAETDNVSPPLESPQGDNLWMTPEFASPEQLRGEAVTTASDVYQLGLLLFILLTGQRPYPVDRKNFVDAIEAICKQEPQAPSTVTTRPTATPDSTSRPELDPEVLSAARAATPRALARRLRGDLDAIVLKALRKEPSARYTSAEQLIADIDRYLGGLPVAAHAGSFAYRGRKFVRRHRLGVAAAAAFVLLTVGYAVTVTVQSRQLAHQRDLARAEAAKAREVKDFLIRIFDSSDPFGRGDADVTARELLLRGAERIEDRFAAQPELRAEMMHLIGQTYSRLGLYDRARPLLEEAFYTRIEVHGERHPDVAESLNELATLHRDVGDYATAERLHRRAAEIRRAHFGDIHPKLSGSVHNLGHVVERQGRYREAEALYREALAIDRRHYGGDLNRDVSYDLNSLGKLLTKLGHLDEAVEMLDQALAIRRRLLGGRHATVAAALHNLGLAKLAVGDLDAAEGLLRQALDIHRESFAPDHPLAAHDLDALARVALERGDHEASAARFNEALAIFEKRLGPEYHFTARTRAHLARLHFARGDPPRAADLLREALVRLERQLPDDHPEVADALYDLGLALTALYENEDAIKALRRCRRIRAAVFGAGDPRTLAVDEALARIVDRG